MKLLVDEDTKAKILMSLLRKAGHDAVSTQDIGIDTADDSNVFAEAQRLGRVMLTKNTEHFFDLHKQHQESGHFGVLVIYQDANPDKDMRYEDIVKALGNIETSKVDLSNEFQSLNTWNWKPDP